MALLRNRTVLGVLCIILSLVICFVVTPMFNRAASETTSIARVASEIKTGEQITAQMLETVEVGGYGLPNTVVRDENDIIGTYALADFAVGDYVLSSKISATMQAENAYLYNLDGSKQAISVTIQDFANGLSGKLESGDIVSVIAPNYEERGETIIPTELKYVEVISVTTESGIDANTGEEYISDDERELPSTVTLLVTPKQSLILAQLESEGEIHLSLVYRGLPEDCKKFISEQDKVLTEMDLEETEAPQAEPQTITESEVDEVVQ